MATQFIEHGITCPGKIDLKNLDQDYVIVKNKDLIERNKVNLENFFNSIDEDVDVIILSSHNEKCKDLKHMGSEEGYDFFESTSPGVVDAFAFKKEKAEELQQKLDASGEEKLGYKLQNLIFNEQLKATFVWPQVYYRPTEEFLNICRQEKEYFINPNISEFSFYWFILTLFISIIFVYFIIDKIPKDRFFYIAKSEDEDE